MNDLLDQIDRATAGGLYYVALLSALALPDMAAALEDPDGRTDGVRYAGWFDANAADRFRGMLSGVECYRFRCSLLHEGSTSHPAGLARVLFVEPGASLHVFHLNVMFQGDDKALNVDVRIFCDDLVGATREWFAANERAEPVRTNLEKFVRRHPEGLAPYIVGVPVIG